MKIGVPTEIKNHEYRVGLVPASVKELTSRGHDVFVQSGAGLGIGMDDNDYRAAGAEISSDAQAVFAAAEVLLPHYTVERLMQAGQSLAQVAHHHGLHVDVVQQVCRLDLVHHRKNGSL